MFDQASLAKVVKETLAPEVDAQHTGAIVGTVDQTGAQVVLLMKRGPDTGFQWQASVAVRHEWAGGTDVTGQVLLKW